MSASITGAGLASRTIPMTTTITAPTRITARTEISGNGYRRAVAIRERTASRLL